MGNNEEDEYCMKCEIVINDTKKEKIVECNSCKHKYHFECLNIKSKTVYNVIVDNVHINYTCTKCLIDTKSKTEILLEKLLHKISIQESELKIIKEKLIQFETSDKKNSVVTNSDPQNYSYANILKKDNVLIVKPKICEKSDPDKTRKELKQLVDPVTNNITLVKSVKDGGVVIRCDTNNLQIVQDEVKEKLGENYDVSVPTFKKPKIKIINMSEKFEPDDLIKKLKTQNDFLKDAELNFIRQESKNRKVRNEKVEHFNAIIELDVTCFDKVMERRRLNIGWDRCFVIEDLDIVKCFNCCGYNHISKHCGNDRACPKCAESHGIAECKNSSKKECANCIRVNKKLHLNLNINHSVWSSDCTVLKRVTNTLRNHMETNV